MVVYRDMFLLLKCCLNWVAPKYSGGSSLNVHIHSTIVLHLKDDIIIFKLEYLSASIAARCF